MFKFFLNKFKITQEKKDKWLSFSLRKDFKLFSFLYFGEILISYVEINLFKNTFVKIIQSNHKINFKNFPNAKEFSGTLYSETYNLEKLKIKYISGKLNFNKIKSLTLIGNNSRIPLQVEEKLLNSTIGIEQGFIRSDLTNITLNGSFVTSNEKIKMLLDPYAEIKLVEDNHLTKALF